MNKYYFNRKPKAAQTEKKEVKKTTSKSKPNLVKKLDRIFSLYIRLRDVMANGYVRCISCGQIKSFEDVDSRETGLPSPSASQIPLPKGEGLACPAGAKKPPPHGDGQTFRSIYNDAFSNASPAAFCKASMEMVQRAARSASEPSAGMSATSSSVLPLR